MPATDFRHFGCELETFSEQTDTTFRTALKIELAGQGIPLKVFGSYSNNIHADISEWKAVPDGSIYDDAGHGDRDCEIVSPKLIGERGRSDLTKVLISLRKLGARINDTCGLHVHQDASDLSGIDLWRTCELYSAYQVAIDSILSPSRRSTRRNQYCNAWYDYTLERLEQAARRYPNDPREVAYHCSERYVTVNLDAYVRHGTIEFRQHQGTLNAKKVIAWATLTSSLVSAAKENRKLPKKYDGGNLLQLLTWLDMPDDQADYLERRQTVLTSASQRRMDYSGPEIDTSAILRRLGQAGIEQPQPMATPIATPPIGVSAYEPIRTPLYNQIGLDANPWPYGEMNLSVEEQIRLDRTNGLDTDVRTVAADGCSCTNCSGHRLYERIIQVTRECARYGCYECRNSERRIHTTNRLIHELYSGEQLGCTCYMCNHMQDLLRDPIPPTPFVEGQARQTQAPTPIVDEFEWPVPMEGPSHQRMIQIGGVYSCGQDSCNECEAIRERYQQWLSIEAAWQTCNCPAICQDYNERRHVLLAAERTIQRERFSRCQCVPCSHMRDVLIYGARYRTGAVITPVDVDQYGGRP